MNAKLAGMISVCSMCIAAGAARGGDSNLPSVKVTTLTNPPVIDGQLDDACWKDAARIELDRIIYSEKKPTVRTEAWLGYDTNWLYVAVRCADQPGAKILASQTGPRNGNVGLDDLVEIFVRPVEESRFPYYHFLLGAGNARREQVVYGPDDNQRNRDWAVRWPSATRVEKNGWTGEMALPLTAFGELQLPGKPMRFNIARIKKTEPQEFIVWAPVGGRNSNLGFHDPERFGYLSGLESRPIQAVCEPLIMSAKNAGLYREKDGKFFYDVAVMVANSGGKAGTAEVILEDTAMDGTVTRSILPVAVPYLGKRTYILTVPVPYPANRTARVVVAAEEKTPSASWVTVADMPILVALVGYPNLTVYTGEPEGRFIIGSAYTDEAFQKAGMRLAVEIRNAKGKTILREQYRQIQNQGVRVPLPVAEWQPGTYAVQVTLQNAKKKTVGELQSVVRVAPPPPADIAVSKVDQEQMCLLVNGRPFFPYGFIGGTTNLPGININQEWFINGIGAALRGFHTVLPPDQWKPWTTNEDATLKMYVDREVQGIPKLYAAGQYTFARPTAHITIPLGNYPVNQRDHDLVMDKLPAVIEPLRGLPGLVAYFGIDELQVNAVAVAREEAQRVRELDPYHVQYTSVHGYLNPEYYTAYDIYSVHDYWAPANGPRRLPYWLASLGRTAKMFRRPIWGVTQGQRLTYKRELTPDERRASMYLDVIQGAKGLLFFGDSSVMNEKVARVFSHIGLEMQCLAPILLRQAPPQAVQSTPVSSPTPAALPPLPRPRTLYDPSYPVVPLHGGFETPDMDLQALVHDRPGGGELILVANATPRRLAVNFALSSLVTPVARGADPGAASSPPAPGNTMSVRDYFLGHEYPVKDGRCEIEFEGYGVRVLETLGSTRAAGSPVSLGLTFRQAGEATAPATGYTNLLVNGGFEEARAAGAGRTGDWMVETGQGARVSDNAHEGAWSFRLEGSSRLARAFELQPDRKYRVSFWARSVIRSGRSRPNYFLTFPPDSGMANTGFGNPGVVPDDEWQEFQIRVTTLQKPVTARMVIGIPPETDGTLWIDDARVEDLSTAGRFLEAEDKRVKMSGYEEKENETIYSAVTTLEQLTRDALPEPGQNILFNSSFEENTMPDLVDCWANSGGYEVIYRADDTRAQDGKVSLLLKTNPSMMYHPSLNPPVRYQYWTSWQSGKTYTFSAWAQADKTNAVLRLFAEPAYQETEPVLFQDLPVGTNWNRLTWTFTVPGAKDKLPWAGRGVATVGFRNMGFKDTQDKDVKIWVDAVQLELGDKATDYKRDPYRAPKAEPKWLSDEIYQDLIKRVTNQAVDR